MEEVDAQQPLLSASAASGQEAVTDGSPHANDMSEAEPQPTPAVDATVTVSAVPSDTAVTDDDIKGAWLAECEAIYKVSLKVIYSHFCLCF